MKFQFLKKNIQIMNHMNFVISDYNLFKINALIQQMILKLLFYIWMTKN